jgi:hypothetical protein
MQISLCTVGPQHPSLIGSSKAWQTRKDKYGTILMVCYNDNPLKESHTVQHKTRFFGE